MPIAQAQLETFLTIRVPPEVLFPYAFAPSQVPLWFHLAGRMEPDGSWPEAGSSFRSKTVFCGREMEAEGVVEQCLAPHRLQVVAAMEGTQVRFGFELRRWGQSTRFFIRAGYSPEGGPLGTIPPVLRHSLLHRHLALSLELLRTMTEHRFPPPAPLQ